MKTLNFILLFVILIITGCSKTAENFPDFLKGNFQDDYGIQYEISEELWFQKPNAKYHIIELNTENKYLITRNDTANPTEPELYTRFDWMEFENMEPYKWGFCMTIYNAETITEAKKIASPDRMNPREGCNGFPFSRMKTTVNNK